MILVCIMEKYESVDSGRKNITTESKTISIQKHILILNQQM